jgi:hypothetical protein
MSRDGDDRFEAWYCADCRLTYIPGETIAALAAQPSDIRVITGDAAASPVSRRRLTCSRCRALSLHELRVQGVTVDICDICGGMVLDEGEERVLGRLSTSASTKVGAAFDHLAWGVDSVARLVALITKPQW